MSIQKCQDFNGAFKDGVAPLLPLVKHFYRGNTIVDVGCNTGAFIDCCLEIFPKCKILGFEPVMEYFEFAENKFNSNKNIKIENYGLSDSEYVAEIFVAEKNIGWNTLVKEMIDEDNCDSKEYIQCICFDDYYKNSDIGLIDIVKIDVEGFEYKVLGGMKQFLKEQHPVILCEIGWGKNHPYWKQELEAFNYLYSIGYNTTNKEHIQNLMGTSDEVFIYTEIK